ncbi:MAG: ATP synthase F1 subunit gamma [Janthinobacterium lividum]
MSNLKHLRNRIKSIKSSEKITRAMQMVSASKLQKIKHLMHSIKSYLSIATEITNNVISNVSVQNLSIEEQQYFYGGNKILLILMTSERGLCGSFNSSIIKGVKADIAKFENQGKEIQLIIVGKKGYEALKDKYSKYLDSYFNMPKQEYETLLILIKKKITTKLFKSEMNECYIYYNKFVNAITQVTTCQRILPLSIGGLEDQIDAIERQDKFHTGPKKIDTLADEKYEIEGENLISTVIELYLAALFNFVLLQSRASEEGARMTAMDNATKNATEMTEKFTLKLNRSRQATITEELIEIISGAEAAAN